MLKQFQLTAICLAAWLGCSGLLLAADRNSSSKAAKSTNATASAEGTNAASTTSTNATGTNATASVSTNLTPTEVQFTTYILGQQDKIGYHIDEDPVKANDFLVLTVSAIGEVYFPVSVSFQDTQIPIVAKGKTLAQVQAELKTKLEAEYYNKATVRLRLLDPNRKAGQVIFTGETRGILSLPPGETKSLSQALVQLGYSEFANLKKVEVSRADPSNNGKPAAPIIVDIDAVLNKNDRSKDLILQDGDYVKVSQKWFNIK